MKTSDRVCCWTFTASLAVWVALLPQPATPAADGSWKTVDGLRIPVPPAEHPRLYVRSGGGLKARLTEPALRDVVQRLGQSSRRSAARGVEWDAVRYLADPDPELGRPLIERTLKLLKQTELADRQDACRETGRMMVTGAIVYDWLHPLLTDVEKAEFIAEFVRLAKTLECGYPPTRQGSVTGHSSEAMIMRDLVSAGIAIYDEHPEMYDLAAGRFFGEHLPVRNWLYDGHAYHQGDSYGPYRFAWDTFPLYIFDRLGAGNVYNPEQRGVPYFYLYATRPDGQRLRGGDTFMHSTARGQAWGEGIGTLLTASYYGDGVLLDQYLRQGGNRDGELLFEFLWRDPQLQPIARGGLPLSRYFGSPFGWMIARTGWDEDAVIAEMKINEYNFVNHQHLDAGAFQIYYRGPLAIDSGLYSGSSGAYGSPHCRNYYWRTIAHNSLLIHDPQEVFGRNPADGNDGGQRLPNGRSEARTLEVLLNKDYRTGQVLAHGFGPDPQQPAFTLLQGDITAAYSSKVRQVLRSMVFLNLGQTDVPAALIVLDRVVAADPAFRKYWLLHTLEEPDVGGPSSVVRGASPPGLEEPQGDSSCVATVDVREHGGQGRLVLDVLWPKADNLQLESIGGPGREFFVFGTNYANDVEPRLLQPGSAEPGGWRIQLSPRQPSAEDLFLNVMQVTDRQTGGRMLIHRLESDDRVGCWLAGAGTARAVLFRRDGVRSRAAVAVEIPVVQTPADGSIGLLVTDLEPGLWRAQPPRGEAPQEIRVTEELGAAWLEGPAGGWKLEYGGP